MMGNPVVKKIKNYRKTLIIRLVRYIVKYLGTLGYRFTQLTKTQTDKSRTKSTVFVPIPAHAPITDHQHHFQFKICGTINRPLKSSYPVASDYLPSPRY